MFTGARTIRQYSHDDAHDHVDLRRTVIDTSARKKQWEHERRSYHDSASASELLTRQKYRQKRNYTMWRLTHAHERPTRGQSNEERETERERKGKLVADATTLCECVYAHVCRRRRVEREPKEKKGRVVTHVEICVCRCTSRSHACAWMVNVCREAYPPVERGTDESVELSAHPTPNPPSKPTPPTVTNPHSASLSLVRASLSTGRFALFLSPFFHTAPCNPPCRCALSHVEEKPMKRGEKRRITQEPRFNEWWNFAGLEISNLITHFISSLLVVLVSRIPEFIERQNLCRWNVL